MSGSVATITPTFRPISISRTLTIESFEHGHAVIGLLQLRETKLQWRPFRQTANAAANVKCLSSDELKIYNIRKKNEVETQTLSKEIMNIKVTWDRI